MLVHVHPSIGCRVGFGDSRVSPVNSAHVTFADSPQATDGAAAKTQAVAEQEAGTVVRDMSAGQVICSSCALASVLLFSYINSLIACLICALKHRTHPRP